MPTNTCRCLQHAYNMPTDEMPTDAYRCIQDAYKVCLQDAYKMHTRSLHDAYKMPTRCLQDAKMPTRYLQDAYYIPTRFLKMSTDAYRCLQMPTSDVIFFHISLHSMDCYHWRHIRIYIDRKITPIWRRTVYLASGRHLVGICRRL